MCCDLFLNCDPTRSESYLVTPAVQAAELKPWLLTVEVYRTKECVIGRSFEDVVKSTLDNIKMLNNEVEFVDNFKLPHRNNYYKQKQILYCVQDGVGQILTNPIFACFSDAEPVWKPLDLDNLTEEAQNEAYTKYAGDGCADVDSYMRLCAKLAKENPTTCFKSIGYHKTYINTRTDSSMLLDLTL